MKTFKINEITDEIFIEFNMDKPWVRSRTVSRSFNDYILTLKYRISYGFNLKLEIHTNTGIRILITTLVLRRNSSNTLLILRKVGQKVPNSSVKELKEQLTLLITDLGFKLKPSLKLKVKSPGKIHAIGLELNSNYFVKFTRIPTNLITTPHDSNFKDYFTIECNDMVVTSYKCLNMTDKRWFTENFGNKLILTIRKTKQATITPNILNYTATLKSTMKAIEKFNVEWEGWDDGKEIKT